MRLNLKLLGALAFIACVLILGVVIKKNIALQKEITALNLQQEALLLHLQKKRELQSKTQGGLTILKEEKDGLKAFNNLNDYLFSTP